MEIARFARERGPNARRRQVRIGANIRARRLALGQMKQTELARGIGVSQSTISRIERGEVSSTTARLSDIATYLETTLAALHRGT